jgi:hypothetical protein
MSSYSDHLEMTPESPACAKHMAVVTLANKVALQAGLNAGPDAGGVTLLLAIRYADTRRFGPPATMHEDSYQCTVNGETVDHPSGDYDYTNAWWWPFRGYNLNRDNGWPLTPRVRLRPGQPVAFPTLRYHAVGDSWNIEATVHVLLELCPDQSLANNCKIPELKNLPPRH